MSIRFLRRPKLHAGGFLAPAPVVVLDSFNSTDGTSFGTAAFAIVSGSQYFMSVASTAGSATPSSITQTGITWTQVVARVHEWVGCAIWSGVASSSTTTAATITFGSSMTGISFQVIRLNEAGAVLQIATDGANPGSDTFDLQANLLDPLTPGSVGLSAAMRNATSGGWNTVTSGLTVLANTSNTGSAGRLATGYAYPTIAGYGWSPSASGIRSACVAAELAGVVA